MLVVDLLEAPHLLALAIEELDHLHSRHVLVHERVEARDLLARFAVRHAHLDAEVIRRPEHRGEGYQCHKCQLRVEREHEVADEEQPPEVAQHGDDARRKQVVEGLDVAGRPCDEAADGRAVEEAESLLLDVPENCCAKVVQGVLADPRRQIAEDERQDGLAHQHRADQQDDAHEPVCITHRDVVIDGDLYQLRPERPEERHAERQHQRDRQPHLVRRQPAEQPPQQLAVELDRGGFIGFQIFDFGFRIWGVEISDF